jgi:hypothetical protein
MGEDELGALAREVLGGTLRAAGDGRIEVLNPALRELTGVPPRV